MVARTGINTINNAATAPANATAPSIFSIFPNMCNTSYHFLFLL